MMTKNSPFLVPIALLIAAFIYAAPDAQVPASGTIAFTGARIVDGTRMMGLKGVGSIEKGNWADLLVLNANPLTDIANARQVDSVYIAGRKVNDAAAN